MSRNLDTIRRLIPKLKDNELTFIRKIVSEESISRDLKKESPIVNTRLFIILRNCFGRGKWDLSFDYEAALKLLATLTEKEFLRYNGVGVAVIAASKLELSKRNMHFAEEDKN